MRIFPAPFSKIGFLGFLFFCYFGFVIPFATGQSCKYFDNSLGTRNRSRGGQNVVGKLRVPYPCSDRADGTRRVPATLPHQSVNGYWVHYRGKGGPITSKFFENFLDKKIGPIWIFCVFFGIRPMGPKSFRQAALAHGSRLAFHREPPQGARSVH
jgi:hypothetical protein